MGAFAASSHRTAAAVVTAGANRWTRRLGVLSSMAAALWFALALAAPLAAEEPGAGEMMLRYYATLAAEGEPYAQLTIGDIFRTGEAVPKDYVQAYAWYFVAAQGGASEALDPMQAVYADLSPAERKEAEQLAAYYLAEYGRKGQ